MSWFQDSFLWPRLLTSGEGRDQLKNDIKYGEGVASVGNPLHGLTAGYKLHELMSPTVHINDRVHDIRKNGFGADHLKWAAEDQNHNLQDAFKENLPALLFAAGGYMGGGGGSAAGGSAGGASSSSGGGLMGMGDITAGWESANAANLSTTMSDIGAPALGGGTNWSSILGSASQGMGLLGQGQQQPQVTMSSPPQQKDNTAFQQQLARQKRLQELRRKPRKSIAEQQEMQELMRDSRGSV